MWPDSIRYDTGKVNPFPPFLGFTLACLGTPEDLTLLQSASNSASRHTAPAIQEAIRAIEERSRPH